jgi:RHS repeat-associated protein
VDRTDITYNPAGQVTKTVSLRPITSTNNGARTVCYRYDGYQRLVAAWTATDSCAATPAVGNSAMVGGDVPMWQTWDYALDGQRTAQTIYQTPGSSTTTATSTYAYDPAGQRHALNSTTTTGGASPSTTSYTYDTAGNAATRTITPSGGSAVTDTFAYTATGRASTISNNAGVSSYLYDADGGVLLRSDPVSGTTLYLAGTEVRIPAGTSTQQATRYYGFAGMTIAQRDSATGLKALYNDPQGTSLVAISWTNLATRTRRTLSPYGTDLGLRNGPWPNPRSFGNQPLNTHTQLVDMGARLYDRGQGRFLQADPIVDPANPDSLNGYTYAGGDPINGNDFSGLMLDGGTRTDESAGTFSDIMSTNPGLGKTYTPKSQKVYKSASALGQKLYDLASAKQTADNMVYFKCGHATSYDNSLDSACATAALNSNQSKYKADVNGAINDAVAAGAIVGTLDYYEGVKAGFQDGQVIEFLKEMAIMSALTYVGGMVAGGVAAAMDEGAVTEVVASRVAAGSGAVADVGVPQIKVGVSGGETAGEKFPESVKAAAKDQNMAETGGDTPICVWCRMESPNPHIDHAWPRSQGGDATLPNAQVACPHCNTSRGSRPYPLTPPSGYVGPWPPPWWPKE